MEIHLSYTLERLYDINRILCKDIEYITTTPYSYLGVEIDSILIKPPAWSYVINELLVP